MLELFCSEPNTFDLKPLIALGEKQATYILHYYDAGRLEQLDPRLPACTESRLHLEREGPVLVHDGTIIVSTFFMLEYIADAMPGPALMPKAAYDAYRARAWGQFLGAQLGSIVPVLGCAKYLRPRLAQLEAATLATQVASIEPVERRAGWQALLDGSYGDRELAAQRNRLRAPVARVEKALGDGPWLAGPEFSIADIDAFAMLKVLPDLAADVVNPEATPRVIEYLGRIGARPSVRDALAISRTGRPAEHFVPGVEASRWG
jgi:GSH-dependent disulfide-bond oxidoreductase